MNLTVLIPSYNEAENLEELIPKLSRSLERITPDSWEILVVEGGSLGPIEAVARKHGARVVFQRKPGYGGAIQTGIEEARGDYLLTMDADLSHEPNFVYKLWENRRQADILIASRYCRGGVAYMPWTRKVLSRILNVFFARGLSLRARDLSSGFRLYRTSLLKEMELQGRNFEILEEILVKAHIAGWNIQEFPFTYFPRVKGSSNARFLNLGLTIYGPSSACGSRNSTEAANYDERAFYSLILPQRYWQRRRHRVITTLARASNYSSNSLHLILSAMGYKILDRKYILKGELFPSVHRILPPNHHSSVSFINRFLKYPCRVISFDHRVCLSPPLPPLMGDL